MEGGSSGAIRPDGDLVARGQLSQQAHVAAQRVEQHGLRAVRSGREGALSPVGGGEACLLVFFLRVMSTSLCSG